MKKITANALLNRGACFSRVKQFMREYPKGCNVCWMCFKEAQEEGWPVAWLTEFLGKRPYFIRERTLQSDFLRRHAVNRNEFGAIRLSDAGLRALEKRLLRVNPPKRDESAQRRFKFWLANHNY